MTENQSAAGGLEEVRKEGLTSTSNAANPAPSSSTSPSSSTASPSHSAPTPAQYRQWLPKPDGTVDPRTLPLSLPPSALAALSTACPLPPDVFSLVRQWAGQQRERFCPPSSYSTLTRSSHTLVDAAACIGFAALTFLRRADVFHRVVACETRDDWADALTANLALYRKADKVSLQRLHVMHYFQQRYDTDSRFACVYWDPAVPSTPPLAVAPAGDDFLFDEPLHLPATAPQPQLSFDGLASCCRHLLSHPHHPVPLLLLKLPAAFNTGLLSSLARHTAEEVAVAKPFGFKFLILAGSPSSATVPVDPSASASSLSPSPAAAPINPYGDPSIVLASSRRQLLFLYSSQQMPVQSHLYQRLKQIMASQLWGCPQAQAQLWRFFNDRMRSALQQQQQGTAHGSGTADAPSLDDEELYDALRGFYHGSLLMTPECAELRKRKTAKKGGEDGCGAEDGRANSRVKELVSLIRRHRFPPPLPSSPASVLDVGCSEGSITASLASALSIPPSDAHGCDVRELPTSPLFTFRLITSTQLPYPSSSFHCVLALMSLHHIDTVTSTLHEIHRVLAPGGMLILREHDLSTPHLAPLLDVMHGLYARVWSDPPEQPHFCQDYYAHYRGRREWQGMIEACGLRQSEESEDRREQAWDRGVKVRRDGSIANPFQFYYALYYKPTDDGQRAGSARSGEKRTREGNEHAESNERSISRQR